MLAKDVLVGDHLAIVIGKAFEAEISASAEDIKKEAYEKLSKRIDEIVAGIALNLTKRISVETIGQEILIRVAVSDFKDKDR